MTEDKFINSFSKLRTGVEQKCRVCGKTTKGALVAVDKNGIRHVWCKDK